MASWDETNPLDNAVVSQYPTNERAARAAVRTNFDVDHHGAEDASIGYHDKATFIEQGSDESAVANAIVLYAKEVDGVTELFSRDSAGNILQLTTGGDLNAFLSGIATAANARAALDLEPGTDVQAYSTHLAAIVALAKTDGNVIVANGTTYVAESGATARASLGVSIGSQVQAYSALLAAIAALTPTDGNVIVGNGTTFVAESGATARASLGLGSMATRNVTISTSAPSGGSDGDLWFVREA